MKTRRTWTGTRTPSVGPDSVTSRRCAPPRLVARVMGGRQSPSAAEQQRGAARGGRGSQRARPGGSQLHEPQFPPQNLVLFAAPWDLQLQHRVAAVHQLADLRHRRVCQHLHDGSELRVEGGGRGHVSTSARLKRNKSGHWVRTEPDRRPAELSLLIQTWMWIHSGCKQSRGKPGSDAWIKATADNPENAHAQSISLHYFQHLIIWAACSLVKSSNSDFSFPTFMR